MDIKQKKLEEPKSTTKKAASKKTMDEKEEPYLSFYPKVFFELLILQL